MSIEERPNVNAVGIATDAIISIQKHIRGFAAVSPQSKSRAMEVTGELVQDFANAISDRLDEEFGWSR